MIILECGTWYHHPRRQQCVLNRNLRIFKVAMWHYRSRHHLKHNCIWDNLLYCCLSFYSWIYISNWTTIQSKDNYDICVYWRKSATCSRSQPLLNMIIGGKCEATLWRYRWRHHLEKKTFFWYDLGRSFHIWGKIEAVFNISNFSKWPPFWAHDKLLYRKFYRKLNIAER